MPNERYTEAARLLADPSTPADVLAHIAEEFPGLRAKVAQHPHAYPGLLAWIEANPAPPAAPRRHLGLIAMAAVAAIAIVAAVTTGAIAITSITSDPTATDSGEPARSANGSTDSPDSGTGTNSTDGQGRGTEDLVSDSASLDPIVFILDASGSMVREAAPGRTRMDDARDATIDTLEDLPDNAEVGFLVFGTGTGNSEAERAAGCQDVKTLSDLGPLNAKRLITDVRDIRESGFTAIGPSLRIAAGMLPADAPGTIVLVSDGVDTCSPPPACEVASELRAANPLLAIHVVGFAVDDDEAAQQQLQCIGGVGGGTFVTAANAEQLSARLGVAADPQRAATALTTSGLHGISLGMTLAEVQRSEADATIIDDRTEGGVRIVYVDCGWATVELRNNQVVSISPTEDTPTADGIGPGDDLEMVERLYGPAVDTGSDDTGDYAVFRAAPGTQAGYRVYVSGSTVRYIVVCRCIPGSDSLDALSEWEVSFTGVGPVRLGDSVEQVLAAVPSAAPPEFFEEYDMYSQWVIVGSEYSSELSVELTPEGRVQSITVGAMWAAEDTIFGSHLPHARGIRVGDSGRTALFAYPGGTGFFFMAAASTSYTVTDREGHTMAFSLNGTVDDIANAVIHGITVDDAGARTSWWQ